ncbi:PKD domain-containing protein [Haloarcula amylovorans]|uniref:PKD domain-containing protein n=1 Tax=Haloarcula amylovorans TaxID=2562280 RepID=UPI001075FE1F|nr:PKD domain-containing protein [Halomicroarcula amylolytica]
MRSARMVVAALAVLVVTTATGTAVAAENQPPLTDAGLDQTVTANTTVFLDANGSRDPDGAIARVEWTIETPSGNTTMPACPTCRQTEFSPNATGRYAVTVRATDDDGATRTDTLYVSVTPARGPTVEISGPATTTRGSETTLVATANATATNVTRVAWLLNGTVLEEESTTGENATSILTSTFETAGRVPIRAVAYDELGYSGTATQPLLVRASGTGGGNNPCAQGITPLYTDGKFEGCMNSADMIYSDGSGNRTVLDVNNDDKIQLHVGGELTDVGAFLGNETIEDYRNGPQTGYNVDAMLEAAEETIEEKDQDSTVGWDPEAASTDNQSGYVPPSAGSSQISTVPVDSADTNQDTEVADYDRGGEHDYSSTDSRSETVSDMTDGASSAGTWGYEDHLSAEGPPSNNVVETDNGGGSGYEPPSNGAGACYTCHAEKESDSSLNDGKSDSSDESEEGLLGGISDWINL